MTMPEAQYLKQLNEKLNPPACQVSVTGLEGGAPAYLLSRLADHVGAPLVVLTADQESADEITRELRFFAARPETVLPFPAWDVTPFEAASPHPDLVGERLNALVRLLDGGVQALVLPVASVLQRVIPRGTLGGVCHYLVAGEELERDGLVEKLVKLGYSHVPLVEDRGTFSVRGGILDIFPPDREQPVRIEFFGDLVETMRLFDPVSQRSLEPLEELVLLPSREVILSEQVVKDLAPRLKRRCDHLGIGADRRRELLDQLQHAIYPPGVEFLQPLFHPQLESILDYAGENAVRVLVDPAAVADALQRFGEDLESAAKRAELRDAIVCDPAELYLTAQELERALATGRRLEFPRLEIEGEGGEKLRVGCAGNQDLRLDTTPEGERVLAPLTEKMVTWIAAGNRVLIPCHQAGQARRLYELLSHYRLPLEHSQDSFRTAASRPAGRVEILIGEISRGFRLEQERLVVIAEEEIFGKRVKRRGLSEAKKKQLLTSLAELKPGDHMVHIDFGVALYRGLQHLSLTGLEGDFLLLEYAGGDKLYLPVDRINLVQRYVGAEGIEPRLDRLGGAGWEKAKAKARAEIQEMAAELLKIHAAREVQEGYRYSPADDMYRAFEASFAFEETPDQAAAIDQVIADMESPRPMDRLVCGDVGYGKTEVAMRAAFKATLDGKQVAILVPTTVLAQQHAESFAARLKDYPVRVEMLSRFRTPQQQKQILEGVKKGEVDIVIGTHRLLQKDVVFKDLGLLIVDEEQRFGVAHKERLKQFRAVVDILTLTATPIPRTLYMSLMGIRDLSIIDTPPVDRLAIKTFVSRSSDELIREAVLRELRRGGQVFFVHNRVQSIGAMAEELRRIVPEAKIAVGHGQMAEKELEQVMLSFMHGEANLLLCTTIIESGLDIPTANTLIVNRADTFGLSQLYQLRGRVGRSKTRAYAYLLIPGEGSISSDARERLKIIQELTELGAGFRIATHDLEIRGAGDLLGARQSGDIAAVGFELYTELLDEAVRTLKGEALPDRVEPEIKLKVPAFIPEDYVRDPNQRLLIYKKLTQPADEAEIDDIREELADRFGPLPVAALFLLEVMRLRVALKRLLVKEIEFSGNELSLAFHERTPVSPDAITGLLRKEKGKYRFTPDFRLYVRVADSSFDGVLAEARNVLKCLV
ncbi:transcription-repair coupling factor [Geomonas subterranea]|uniref:Transcription-repair-coupling factor n=1 Tax=Geomonas subterranea TaxID=2847989 RepID=A0ABX8LG40_9BACT|nr:MULTISPECIES: transcription-repair coupling factor [Geomonas]QXE89866.1 transcription-repair coupling factor [Geomonas subterranea]QXM08015.1 transcription-repair coupling factor [Geomonas subterranea]